RIPPVGTARLQRSTTSVRGVSASATGTSSSAARTTARICGACGGDVFLSLVRGICGSLMRSNGGRKFGSRGRRTPDGELSAFVFVANWLWNQLALPDKLRRQTGLIRKKLPHRNFVAETIATSRGPVGPTSQVIRTCRVAPP